jgi:hypothetical protein
MSLNDIQKAQVLVNALLDGLDQQQEILTGLRHSIQEYLKFLQESLKEQQNELRITDHE